LLSPNRLPASPSNAKRQGKARETGIWSRSASRDATHGSNMAQGEKLPFAKKTVDLLDSVSWIIGLRLCQGVAHTVGG